ncbi:hypothetical protein D3C73_592730 [compost metagenome]
MENRELDRCVVFSQYGGKRRSCITRLLPGHHAFDQFETRAVLVCRPVEDRIPLLLLAKNEVLRAFSPVAEHVAGREAQNILEHGLSLDGNTVDGGIDQARHRHGPRIDDLHLVRPFVTQQFRKLGRRHSECGLGRRFHRATVEIDCMPALAFNDRDLGVETLRQRLLHLDLRPPCRVRMAHRF